MDWSLESILMPGWRRLQTTQSYKDSQGEVRCFVNGELWVNTPTRQANQTLRGEKKIRE